MPAWPAYLVLFASIPLLVPTFARRLGDRVRPTANQPSRAALGRRRTRPHRRRPSRSDRRLVPDRAADPAVVQEFPSGNILTPIDDRIDVSRRAVGRRPEDHVVGPDLPRERLLPRVPKRRAGGRAVRALLRASAWSCYLRATPIATTQDREYVDTAAPDDGDVTYRIGDRDELARRPGARRRLRLQSTRSSGCSLTRSPASRRDARSSSSATRCARSTFSSVSFEITVE